ncbi:MAG: cyclic nucleotide-binding domain-containing protein [Planctomycetes bacterium]|nr:cyclic nucleotide-binding domain-containing protein [Planctomycetota bacterium]
MPDDLANDPLAKDLRRQPLLENLSDRYMKYLVKAIRTGAYPEPPTQQWLASVQDVAAGHVFVQQGAFSTDFFVLLRGVVRATRAQERGRSLKLGEIRGRDGWNWFGEVAILSSRPAFATLKAVDPCRVLQIDREGFTRLSRDRGLEAANPKFGSLTEESFRRRSTEELLRGAPVLEPLDQEEIEALAAKAEPRTYKEGETVAQAGVAADGVYVVQGGIVKVVLEKDGRQRFHAALGPASSFGERALTQEGKWPATYVAMTRVDVLKLPRELFQEVYGGNERTRKNLEDTATVLVDREEGRLGASARHTVKAADVLVIDLHRCTRCNACVEACVSVHEDRVPRLSKRGMVTEDRTSVLTSACYHCQSPDCMVSCNFGAIRRSLNGEIDFVYDACTGCTQCELSCPYGVIRMAWVAGEAAGAEGREGAEGGGGRAEGESGPRASRLLRSLPILRGIFGGSARRAPEQSAEAAKTTEGETRRKKAIKCDFCAGMPFEACVYNCPCSAIRRVSPEELEFEAAGAT